VFAEDPHRTVYCVARCVTRFWLLSPAKRKKMSGTDYLVLLLSLLLFVLFVFIELLGLDQGKEKTNSSYIQFF